MRHEPPERPRAAASAVSSTRPSSSEKGIPSSAIAGASTTGKGSARSAVSYRRNGSDERFRMAWSVYTASSTLPAREVGLSRHCSRSVWPPAGRGLLELSVTMWLSLRRS